MRAAFALAQAIPLDQLRAMYNNAVEMIQYWERCLSEERQLCDKWEYAYQRVADMLYG